jgi:hypothetical protein
LALSAFFQGVPLHLPGPPHHLPSDGPVFIEGARVRPLLDSSFLYQAIELHTREPSRREALWVYRIRQNAVAIETATPVPATNAILFASGQMPYSASPRFDVNQWDYSNYSSTLLGPAGP